MQVSVVGQVTAIVRGRGFSGGYGGGYGGTSWSRKARSAE